MIAQAPCVQQPINGPLTHHSRSPVQRLPAPLPLNTPKPEKSLKEIALLAVPAPRLLADGAERRAVQLRQIVEPGVALMEPLHRDGTAIGPAVPARVRLLSDLNLPRLGIDKPGQALGLPCRLP